MRLLHSLLYIQLVTFGSINAAHACGICNILDRAEAGHRELRAQSVDWNELTRRNGSIVEAGDRKAAESLEYYRRAQTENEIMESAGITVNLSETMQGRPVQLYSMRLDWSEDYVDPRIGHRRHPHGRSLADCRHSDVRLSFANTDLELFSRRQIVPHRPKNDYAWANAKDSRDLKHYCAGLSSLGAFSLERGEKNSMTLNYTKEHIYYGKSIVRQALACNLKKKTGWWSSTIFLVCNTVRYSGGLTGFIVFSVRDASGLDLNQIHEIDERDKKVILD